MTADLRAEILAALEVSATAGLAVIERLAAAGFEIVRRPSTPTVAPTLYGAGEVAAVFQVDLKTIHNWVDHGQLEGCRTPGRHLRFTRANLEALVARAGYPAALLEALPAPKRRAGTSA